ncbi:BatA domain-containing protein [Aureliella helgolandensis]|uniref:Aerotolerance regulator N-terminal domain-containing protein n=1 Tax=Aureliella helgolandensis TaxID=2527968 RepID=A0A518G6X9_9BACT|nr:BatA domain-containing protein [Aureliella helgolandensis]QDV24347.1 hypothetical protein Q31a_26630 [Aureliella helgolandensis]
MQFLYQPLTWGFLLIGVPILVHLINMLRHRKQKWAAMDFLLESHRRNRRWVMLKQWLLLASRILAMLLLVAMLAKWVSNSQWLGLLGGQTTHHYILLDDSYSMEEVEQGESAYARALHALSGIVRSISARGGQHQITLLRFSRAALAAGGAEEEARIDSAADLIAQSVPRDPGRLLDRINATAPTALQLSPAESLDMIIPMVAANSQESAEVYLLTDLRRNEFGEPETLRAKLQTLSDTEAQLKLVDCGKAATANLSVAAIDPEQEVWAAGVPLMVRFQIRNQATQPAKNVVVRVKAISYGEGTTTPQPDQPYSGITLDLPPVVIEQIGAGETVTRQVQVIFGEPGQHVVEVMLPDDGLKTDNQRWCVIGIQESQKLLLVDGEVAGSNSYFFEAAMEPSQRLRTGLEIERVDAAFLRDISPAVLEQYDVVGLLDVPRLDPQAVTKLEEFCRQGRGLFVHVGRNTNIQFVNQQLHRGGEGFFPIELSSILEIPQALENSEPQVAATAHPVLAPLTQLSSSPFFLIRIRQQMLATGESLKSPTLEVVAWGPEKTPLILDKPFGEGRVITLLTGLTADWSNWAQDPTFVVLALRSMGYLSSFRRDATSWPVGSPLEMVVRGTRVLPDAEVLIPNREGTARLRLQRKVDESTVGDTVEPLARLEVDVNSVNLDRALVDGMLRPGVFESWMIDVQGTPIVQNVAHNVAAAEGNLQRVSRSELETKFSGIAFDFRTADAVSGAGITLQEASQSTLLLALLSLLLLGEQWLAYSASYHAPRTTGRAR